jgi:hypothetical protein
MTDYGNKPDALSHSGDDRNVMHQGRNVGKVIFNEAPSAALIAYEAWVESSVGNIPLWQSPQ